MELIQGELIDMTPIGSRHAGTVAHLAKLLERTVGELAIVWIQSPVILGEDSEPQPDIALLKPRNDFYKGTLPNAQDIRLIIEIADTSLRYDREVKVPLYARHNVPEVWLVDLEHNVVHVYTQPAEKAYGRVAHLSSTAHLSPQAFPQAIIFLGHLF